MGILDKIEYKLQARKQAIKEKQEAKEQWEKDHPEVLKLKKKAGKFISKMLK